MVRSIHDVGGANAMHRRIVYQATAFVVDKERGLLLTAAHCFLVLGHRRPGGETRPKYLKDCSGTCCIILVRANGCGHACVFFLVPNSLQVEVEVKLRSGMGLNSRP